MCAGNRRRRSVERKMLCRNVLPVFTTLCFLVLANGMPQDTSQPQGSLPFIQFTNGGIRFNFGGYHAEAGLGGLLSGSRTGGGLHASAGTPWGAHAAAGLGGLLGGDNANAGGGLYARAGLGNGRHEAAAGLGGALDGSGRARPLVGGLYAGATTGTHGVGVATGSAASAPHGNAGGNNAPSGEGKKEAKSGGGGTNIQIISKHPDNGNQVAVSASASNGGSIETPKQTDSAANTEIRAVQSLEPVPAVGGSIFGAIPVAQVANELDRMIGDSVERAPLVPPLPSANEVVQLEYRPPRLRSHAKRIIRKRVWGPRKQVIYDIAAESPDEPRAQSHVQKRQATYYARGNAAANANSAGSQPSADSGGLYDDIFQIPISTLTAVNKLLNNNAG